MINPITAYFWYRKHRQWTIDYAAGHRVHLTKIRNIYALNSTFDLAEQEIASKDQGYTDGYVSFLEPFKDKLNVVHETVFRFQTHINYYYKYERVFYSTVGIRIVDSVLLFDSFSLYYLYVNWLKRFSEKTRKEKKTNNIRAVIDFIPKPSTHQGVDMEFTLKSPGLRFEPSDLAKIFSN